ncbi:GntR family transcriptional regulator [Advenella alkanexedens]|uniref:GntR family transcriptional regulator n=1 Tax=Advenella alkanexedens TaxID=1481665 RepID=A0ABS6NLT7_9BURK|nr:GntR family transcriptional regulator [Advenella alkanexedens]MBV4396593.1 GntR family transcriptional regulator [Advenella alkanexedens]
MSSKNMQAYALIRDRLFTGRYAFGDSISVKELSEETKISRQPIMTALYRLQEQGFIEITAQVGSRVVQPALQEVLDFYQMFAAIEGVLAGLAANRVQPGQIEKLQDINHRIDALDPDDPNIEQAYRSLNIAFHTELHALAQSPQVSLRQQANFDLSDFYMLQTTGFKQNLHVASQAHQDLIVAIREKNVALAINIASHHILDVGEYLKRNWQE